CSSIHTQLASSSKKIQKKRLHGEEMGPARPLGGGAVALGGALMMIVRSYQHQCTGSHQNSAVKRAWARVVLGWVTSWEVLVLHFFFSTSFLPVLSTADPRPGSSAPAGRASGRAGLHGEEMGPARPLCCGALALGSALMMIVCAYIGSTSFLPVLPAADPRPGSSAPAGRASVRAGLHGEELGPARPLGGAAVALGGALMMINSAVKRAWARVVLGWVISWEVLVLHLFFSTSFLPVPPAADPRPGSSAPTGRASGRAGLHGEEMGPARPHCGGAVALGGALMMIVCAYIGRCDHTSTNALDPIRTP
ncbi:hypothetical protein PIB30_108489, partial [Stylosanthes scabra]|nr:hypothetical protein [Stylosanthes scabra]